MQIGADTRSQFHANVDPPIHPVPCSSVAVSFVEHTVLDVHLFCCVFQ